MIMRVCNMLLNSLKNVLTRINLQGLFHVASSPVRVYIRSLHVTNGVLKCPFFDSLKVAALMKAVEFWPWQRITFLHVEGENSNVCITFDVLA